MIDTLNAVLAAILLLVQIIGSARDALFDRGTILPDANAPDAPEGLGEVGRQERRMFMVQSPYVSWRWRHYFIWGERWTVQAVALIVLARSLWNEVWMPSVLLIALLVISLHSPVYRWVYIHRWKFAGDESRPRWYLIVSKLWRWIPWT